MSHSTVCARGRIGFTILFCFVLCLTSPHPSSWCSPVLFLFKTFLFTYSSSSLRLGLDRHVFPRRQADFSLDGSIRTPASSFFPSSPGKHAALVGPSKSEACLHRPVGDLKLGHQVRASPLKVLARSFLHQPKRGYKTPIFAMRNSKRQHKCESIQLTKKHVFSTCCLLATC